jgi:hypothetical protein
MRHLVAVVVAQVALTLAFAVPAYAKGPVVKLVLTGADLLVPVDVSEPDAINVIVYGATAPYMIQFHIELPSDEVRMMYVVQRGCSIRHRYERCG